METYGTDIPGAGDIALTCMIYRNLTTEYHHMRVQASNVHLVAAWTTGLEKLGSTFCLKRMRLPEEAKV